MITSPSNKRVARAVRLKKRAMREKDRRFLLEGAQGVGEALASGIRLEAIFYTLPAGDRLDLVLEGARRAGAPAYEVSEDIMGRLTSTVTPQGVVAVAPFVDVPLASIPDAPRCVPVLVEVRDPGNAGTILRSADAAGADAVVFTHASVDVYNEKCVRATAGSLFHIPFVRDADLGEAVIELRRRGVQVLAATAAGDVPVHEADLARPTAILFGNEAHGLDPDALARADATVRVPIHGRAESLNLAAATALVLFEAARQRTAGPGLSPIVSGAAHDIRSPLTALLGFGQTLLRRWDDLPDAQRREMVEAMVHDARRMRAILVQLVDAARLASGALELSLEPVDVAQAAGRVADEATTAGGPAVEVEGVPVRVRADRERVLTMLRAMVDAAAWWGADGPVRVSVAEDGGARVEVSRAGGSLDEGEARRLFERGPEGGGGRIGLLVARGLAEAHGGSLDVRTGGEVRFVLALPALA